MRARSYLDWTGKILLLGCLIYFTSFSILPAAAASEAKNTEPAFSLEDTIENLDIESLEEYKRNIDGEINEYLEGKSLKQWILDFVSGDWEFDIRESGENLMRFFFKEVMANSGLLGKLLILSVLAALLINLQTAFSSGVARISYLACFMALATIAVGSFRVVLDIGQQTIENMTSFMLAMLPQMLVLTAGMGNLNSAVMLFPFLMTAATAFATAIKNIVFPLIIMSAILTIVNHMSDTIKVERVARFFGQLAQISLGFFLTIFVGIVTLRAVYASVLDKVTLRTSKFITDNAIPVVGKIFSDTIEVAAGYLLMLKQALGIFGVIVVFGIIVFPILKVAAIALIYKISAAIVEPLGDVKTAALLESLSKHLFLILAAVASVALMFFIMIAIVAGMSNGLGMLR
jgi:stage III sporulation protein AE